ncbi:hypothetical protein [Sphingomonas sp.]|uniref:hypothetical protein n=1 Tax=Sphingomonas sp. TaxID=28214 RepID=UPI003B3B1C83
MDALSKGLMAALQSDGESRPGSTPAPIATPQQERLIGAQIGQLRRAMWRDVVFLLIGIAVLIGGLTMVWSAVNAGGVIVEPFRVPPALQQRGLSGEVVAAQLLDKLAAMQAGTSSMRARSTYTNNWGTDIKVQIPYTGASLGQIQRYLHDWLGHEDRLSGEVIRLPDGRIAISGRVGRGSATQVEGREDMLDALLQQVAQSIYEQTQPYRYGVWLMRQNRLPEAKAAFERLTTSDDIEDRAWAYIGLGNVAARFDDKRNAWLNALRVRPDFGPALYNLASNEYGAGHEELSWRYSRRISDNPRTMERAVDPAGFKGALADIQSSVAYMVGDFAGGAEAGRRSYSLADNAALAASLAPLNTAVGLARAHELDAIPAALADAGINSPAALTAAIEHLGRDADPAPWIAAAMGDWPRARDLWFRNLQALQSEETDALYVDTALEIRAMLSIAQAHTGQLSQASGTLMRTPLDCAPCVRARGIVAALAGRHREADRWFARALALTPSLPFAHEAYAEALIKRGDAPAALQQARLAVQKGPRWADAHKRLGDAQLLAGHADDAIRAYRQAERIAPRWGRLQIDLADALWHSGARGDARAALQKATTLQLSSADKRRLNRKRAIAATITAA